MWDLPGPGLEPVSPAGGFLTTAPPGTPGKSHDVKIFSSSGFNVSSFTGTAASFFSLVNLMQTPGPEVGEVKP